MTIGVSELQKNISIIRNLKETLYVIDKKTNELLATVLPNKKEQKKSLTEELAGSMANGIVIDDLDKAISEAYTDAMMKKHGDLISDK
jgi:hypothetical protein